MSASVMTNDRLVELLVQRATEGLSANEQVELNRLLAQNDYYDADQFDTTTAAVTLAVLDDEPLPASLADRLARQADAFSITANDPSVAMLVPKVAAPKATTGKSATIGWLAAAACAVFAIVGWWPRLEGNRGGDLAATDITQAREELLAQATVLQREWKPTEDPSGRGVTGDIVWDAKSQRGYMRFRGLPANDPRQLQYQLWIFDKTRGDQYPVDGGVFDIPQSGGDVVVPIFARIPVRDPALFAVTIEKPGGAVVSMRERIVVVAPVAAG